MQQGIFTQAGFQPLTEVSHGHLSSSIKCGPLLQKENEARHGCMTLGKACNVIR